MSCKRILALPLIVLSSPVFSGFYIGAAAGPEGASFSQKVHVTRAGTFNVVDKNNFAGTGGFGSLFAGYGLVSDKLYLAGEINGNLSSVKYQLTNDEYIYHNFSKTTFRIRHSVGASLLPGVFLSPSALIYGRIGYINGRLKISESDSTIQNFNTNRSGLRYGGGIRYTIKPRLSFMMDYSQINYKRVKSHVFEPFSGVNKNTRISPTTAQVAFGLIYSFDAPKEVYVK